MPPMMTRYNTKTGPGGTSYTMNGRQYMNLAPGSTYSGPIPGTAEYAQAMGGALKPNQQWLLGQYGQQNQPQQMAANQANPYGLQQGGDQGPTFGMNADGSVNYGDVSYGTQPGGGVTATAAPGSPPQLGGPGSVPQPTGGGPGSMRPGIRQTTTGPGTAYGPLAAGPGGDIAYGTQPGGGVTATGAPSVPPQLGGPGSIPQFSGGGPAGGGTVPNASLGTLPVGGGGGASAQQAVRPALPGQNTQQSTSTSSTRTAIVPGMPEVYKQLLAMNQQNYGNVLQAYTQGQQNQNQQLPGIYQGFDTLQGDVANTMGMGAALGQNGNWGVASPAAKAIAAAAQQGGANVTQQMAGAGLGNTTAMGNAQNQVTSQAETAYGNLGAQLAEKYANQQMGIGLAGQAARMQGLGMQSTLAAQRGGALAGYDFKNTAGSLTGSFGDSSSQSSGSSQQYNPNASTDAALRQAQANRNQLPTPDINSPLGAIGAGLGAGGSYLGGGVGIPGVPGYNPATAYNPSTGDYGITGWANVSPANGPGQQIQGGQFNQVVNPANPVTGGGITGYANLSPANGPGQQPQGGQFNQTTGEPYDPAQLQEGDMLPGGYQMHADTRWNVVGPKNIPVPKDATPAQRAAMLAAHGVDPNNPAYK